MGHATLKLTLDTYGQLWPDESADRARARAVESVPWHLVFPLLKERSRRQPFVLRRCHSVVAAGTKMAI
jgi:hypothetical protein